MSTPNIASIITCHACSATAYTSRRQAKSALRIRRARSRGLLAPGEYLRVVPCRSTGLYHIRTVCRRYTVNLNGPIPQTAPLGVAA
jgi:hypothetical protein